MALFLDDLQWLDAATLDMLADLLTQADVQQLLVIGAYRDNEVGSAHPLMPKLDAVRKEGAFVQEISLAPLAREDLGGSSRIRSAARRAVPRRWRNWCTRRRAAIRFSQLSSFLRSPKRGCSASIMMQRAGAGSSIAFTPRGTPTMWWTSWSGS